MRRLALGLGIAFSLAMWLAGFALVDLVGTWFLGEPGTVSDLGYGALGGIVVPAGFLLAWKDARALRQVFAAALAYALAGAVSTDPATSASPCSSDRGASARGAASRPGCDSRPTAVAGARRPRNGIHMPGTSPTASLPTNCRPRPWTGLAALAFALRS